MRARFYDPVTGTFLLCDPLVAQTGAPYGYAGGNSVSNTNPSRLCLGLGNGGSPGADQLYNALRIGVGRAATTTLAGFYDGASLGLTHDIREAISPGSSCTFDHNDLYFGGVGVGVGVGIGLYATGGAGASKAGSRFTTACVTCLRETSALLAVEDCRELPERSSVAGWSGGRDGCRGHHISRRRGQPDRAA